MAHNEFKRFVRVIQLAASTAETSLKYLALPMRSCCLSQVAY